MSDDPPRKRAWFQIYLSTAIVLMRVAGVLVWAKVRPDTTADYGRPIEFYSRGWPYWFVDQYPPTGFSVWHIWELMGDVLAAFAIPSTIAVGCEWRVRRRNIQND